VSATIEVRPVTPDQWADLERLAGERGFYSNCWCTWWRLPSKEFSARPPHEKRAILRDAVDSGPPPGLLAYLDGEPVGWVAVAPRHELVRIERSPKLRPVDERPAWSISCFSIDRRHRRQGVATALLDAAVALARAHGAELVEAYPIDTSSRDRSNAELFTGTLAMFERAGFVEVTRRGGRPIVRREVRQRAGSRTTARAAVAAVRGDRDSR
jgi:ribosomal protein S18 acetylase RimI-like enzyme